MVTDWSIQYREQVKVMIYERVGLPVGHAYSVKRRHRRGHESPFPELVFSPAPKDYDRWDIHYRKLLLPIKGRYHKTFLLDGSTKGSPSGLRALPVATLYGFVGVPPTRVATLYGQF